MRCKQENAVITPISLAVELADGHQLERGHAERNQMVQFSARAIEAALGGEAAQMRFVKHCLLPRSPTPFRMLPSVRQGRHNQAWSVNILRLRARGWIGNGHAVG